MKQLRKITIILLFASISANSIAQLSVSFRAGINQTMFKVSDQAADNNGVKYDLGNKASIMAAGDIDFQIGYFLWIRTGIGYSQQNVGIDFKNQFPNVMPYAEYTLNYIDFPLLLKAGIEFNNRDLLFFTVGPNFGIGVKGRMVIDHQSQQNPNAEDEERKIVWDGNEGDNPLVKDHLRRLNLGLNTSLGYQLRGGLLIQFQYVAALSNMAPNKDNIFKSSYFGGSIGFRLYNE